MRNRACGIVALVLVGLQVLVIVASWIITAAMPDITMHSLLSSSGIRWFFGHFASNLNTTLLVDLLLLMIACGAVSFSGLTNTITNIIRRKRLGYFEKVAFWVAVAELIISIIVVILLTLVPHAILLSITGHLFPSSFSASIVPIISVTLLICSVSFGVISNRLSSLSQIYEAMTYGLVRFAWFIPIYAFGMELYASLAYVFAF